MRIHLGCVLFHPGRTRALDSHSPRVPSATEIGILYRRPAPGPRSSVPALDVSGALRWVFDCECRYPLRYRRSSLTSKSVHNRSGKNS